MYNFLQLNNLMIGFSKVFKICSAKKLYAVFTCTDKNDRIKIIALQYEPQEKQTINITK